MLHSEFFTEKGLISLGNKMLADAGSKTRLESIIPQRDTTRAIMFKTTRGAKVVAPIMHSGLLPVITFRSLLKIVNKRQSANWLINGQASKNTAELTFTGENGIRLIANKSNLKTVLDAKFTGYDRHVSHVKNKSEYQFEDEMLVDYSTDEIVPLN